MDKDVKDVKEIKIIKRNLHFITVTNSISLIAIIFLIVVIYLWYWILQKENNAPLVIQSNGTPDVPTYVNGEKDTTYPTSGYGFASLGQPCVQEHNQAGVPNLPEAYQTPGCNETDRKICVENFVKGGGICLSAIGGVCKSLYDCAPGQGTTNCLNSVCVNILEFDTLNQPCITDIGCQQSGQNHICDPQQKICKYNYFPYESGCLVDEDCLSDDQYNNNTCFHIDSDGLSLDTVYNIQTEGVKNIGYFIILDNEINSPNLPFFGKNISVSIIDDDNNYSVYLLTSNLIPIPGQDGQSGYSALYISGSPMLSGQEATIIVGNTGGRQLGICVSKIPRGGKIIQIAGVDIPCDDGLIKSDGFCVKNNFFSGVDVICDKRGNVKAMKCDPNKTEQFTDPTTGEKVELKLTCLASTFIKDSFSKNFNFSYPSSSEFRDEIPYLGYCNYQTQNHLASCDPIYNNCKEPYLCISAQNKNGRIINFCGTDFNRQECFVNSQCSDGFECSDNICLSINNNICLESSDCDPTSTCNTQNRYVYYYSIVDSKYVKLFPVINYFDEIEIKIRHNSELISNQTSSFKGIPTKFLTYSVETVLIPTPSSSGTLNGYQSITSNNYTGQQALLTLYTYSETNDTYNSQNVTVNLYPFGSGNQFTDFIFNSSEQIYAIYRKNSEADRIRKMVINNIPGNSRFNLNINSGFSDGDQVIYTGGTIYPQDTNYYIRIEQGSTVNGIIEENFYLSSTSSGSAITMDNTNQPYGQIWSTSKNYYLQAPEQANAQYQSTLIGNIFENGDSLTIETGRTLTVNSSQFTDTTFYVQKTSNLTGYPISPTGTNKSTSFFYQLTDQYEQSQGSVPYIDGSRTQIQKIYVNNSDSDGFFFNSELNTDKINYSVSLIQFSQGTQYIIKDQNYVDGNLNGINSSMSYNFDPPTSSTEDDISFNLFSQNGDDYILLKKNLAYGSDSQLPLVQRFKISNTITKPTSGVYLETKYLSANTSTTIYFTLDYDLTCSPPLPLHLYFSENTFGQNNIGQVKNSPLEFDLNQMNIISTYENSQYISTNTDPTNIVVSSLEKTQFSTDGLSANDPPDIIYSQSNLKTGSIQIDIINVQKYDGKSKINTYEIDTSLITIRVENDIDTILKYGSSELVLVKDVGAFSIDVPSGVNGDNFWNRGNITLVVSSIQSYDIGIRGEVLILQTNTPLISDNGVRQHILNTGNTWELYVNNIYPVYFRQVVLTSSTSVKLPTYLYNIFDASGIYTSTKQDSFFDSNIYRPTSYNKLFSDIPTLLPGSITAIYLNDGYGNDDDYNSNLIANDTQPLLPNLIAYKGNNNISIPSPDTTSYPLYDLRTNGIIFGFFYPINSGVMLSDLSADPVQNEVFIGQPFIRSVGDYSGTIPLSMDKSGNLTYVRPINSGVIKITSEGDYQSGVVYVVNNMYLSSIPRSLNTKPYFNTYIPQQNFSIFTTGRRKGSIEAGINVSPYYPIIDGTVTNLDQSYQKIVRWPSWIFENRLVDYSNVPIIKKVFYSPKGGNFKGDFNYYVLAEIDGKQNFYYFSSSNSSQNVMKNQGVPVSSSVYNEETDLYGEMIGQDFFLVGSTCSTKTFKLV